MRRITVILLILSLIGCTTTRSYTNLGPQHDSKLKPGDSISIEFADGRSGKYRVLELGEQGLTVADHFGAASTYDYADIDEIEVERVDGARLATGVLIASAVVIALLASALDDFAIFPAGP